MKSDLLTLNSARLPGRYQAEFTGNNYKNDMAQIIERIKTENRKNETLMQRAQKRILEKGTRYDDESRSSSDRLSNQFKERRKTDKSIRKSSDNRSNLSGGREYGWRGHNRLGTGSASVGGDS